MLSLEQQNAWREQYRQIVPDWRPATEVFADLVRIHLQPDSRVLDFGCGRGGLVEQLTHPLTQIVGIDPDWRSVREHRLALPRVAGSGRLPFAAASFDVVYASWVLEHWRSPGDELAEIARVLRPNGVFVFITPNKHHPLIWLNRLLGSVAGIQKAAVAQIYGRAEADTFPVFYRASSSAELSRLAATQQLELVRLDAIPDPTYLAFTPMLFHLFCQLEKAVPEAQRLHLVGCLQKPATLKAL
jgi:SAM-dependent methyltransferase